jgi:peptide/nickel transport system substrate-binding protein
MPNSRLIVTSHFEAAPSARSYFGERSRMGKKVWLGGSLSVIALSVLAALLAVTASAGSAQHRAGMTLNFGEAGADVDFSDPALAYGVLSWEIEYSTCAKLVNYPDVEGSKGSELQPGEPTTGFPAISNGGKTYTFTIKPGIRFSDGAPLTAADFVYVFNRDASKTMQSPVTPFVTDIKGWMDVVNGKASKVAGVTSKGNKLTIQLTHPDGGLLNKLAMPFFCAVEPSKTPLDPKGVDALPAAGPYYIASRTEGKQLVLKRNPYYRGKRPHRADTIVFTMNTNQQQTYLEVSNGTFAADPSGLDDPTAAQSLAQKYGINKGRFFVHPLIETDWLVMNTARPTFKTLASRKAANYGIDRPAVLRTRGYAGGVRTDTILPSALAGGYWGQKIFPFSGADPNKAKQINPNCGDVNLWGGQTTLATQQEGIVRYNLTQMGCKVTVKQFGGFAIYTAAGVRGNDMDMMFAGWNADYPDPDDFFSILLDGRNIHAQNNNDYGYVNDPTLNRKIDEANVLTGSDRAKAFGKLDIWTTTNVAPFVVIDNRNQRDFVAPNIGGYVFQPAYAAMDFNTMYTK